MSPTSSPSLQEYKDGIPEKRHDPDSRKKIFRIVLLVLLVVALGLLSTHFFGSDLAALMAGKGTLSGRVTDEHGQALTAQVYIFGVDQPVKTAADGSFMYKNAPAGSHNLIIAYHGTAQKYTIQVQPGTTTDLGSLAFKVVTPTAP